MPTGTYGGVRGWGREAPAYSIFLASIDSGESKCSFQECSFHREDNSMTSFACPACGSDRIQKARILSRAGIPINNEAARILSPPVEPTSPIEPAGRFSVYIGTTLLIISVYILVTLHTAHSDRIGLFLQTMGVILVLLGFSLLALSQIQLNAKKPKYKEDYAKWERLWYCSHCRNTFYDA
jgi:hypothetical protein